MLTLVYENMYAYVFSPEGVEELGYLYIPQVSPHPRGVLIPQYF